MIIIKFSILKNKEINKYLKKSFFTGSVKTILVSLTTLGLLPLIIATIGMDRYGLVSITMLFGGGVVLVDLGISKAVTLLIGKSDNDEENNRVVADASMLTFTMLLLLSFFVLIIILFDIPILGSLLNIDQQLYNYIIFIGFMTLVVMMVNNLCIAILEACLLMHFVNVGFGLSSILFHVLLFVAGFLGASNYILVSIPLISFLIITCYYLVIISKKTLISIVKPNFTRSKEIIPISLKFLGISMVSSIANPLNKYALIFLSGNTTIIGVYDVSLKIAFLANSLLNNLAQPLFGLFSKMSKETTLVFKTAKRISLLIFGLYCIGIIFYLFIGSYIARFIDLENSNLLYTTSIILLSGVCFNAVAEPFYRAVIGLSLLRKAMYYKSSLIVFNLVLFVILVKLDALNRVVVSYSLAFVLSSIVIIIGVLNTSKKLTLK